VVTFDGTNSVKLQYQSFDCFASEMHKDITNFLELLDAATTIYSLFPPAYDFQILCLDTIKISLFKDCHLLLKYSSESNTASFFSDLSLSSSLPDGTATAITFFLKILLRRKAFFVPGMLNVCFKLILESQHIPEFCVGS
jgi:hypothetical protein